MADDDQCGRQGCRCTSDEEDDVSGEAAVREDKTAAAPCRCSGGKSNDDEVMLRSTATTSGGGTWAVTLQPEGATQWQHEA